MPNEYEYFENLQPLGPDKLPMDLLTKQMEMKMVETNNKGVNGLLVIITFILGLYTAVQQILADKTQSWLKIVFKNIDLLETIPDVIAAAKDVPAEVMDQITDDEKAQIEAPILASDAIPTESKEFIKDLIDLIIQIKAFIVKHFVKWPAVATPAPPAPPAPPAA